MAMKNHPVDTVCKRLIRKGLDEWPAFRHGHPGSFGDDAVDRLVAACLRDGVKRIFVKDVREQDDRSRVESLVVFLPETTFKQQAVVSTCRRFEEAQGCPEPGKWFGLQALVVRCLPDAVGLE